MFQGKFGTAIEKKKCDHETLLFVAELSFTVASRHLPALLGGGWRIAVASGTTHVP
jgi:hypothetical protein